MTSPRKSTKKTAAKTPAKKTPAKKTVAKVQPRPKAVAPPEPDPVVAPKKVNVVQQLKALVPALKAHAEQTQDVRFLHIARLAERTLDDPVFNRGRLKDKVA